MSAVEPELELMFEPLLDVVPLVVPLVVLPLLVPFDIVVPVPLSLVPVPFVVPVVLQPNSARLRVSTAMRGRTALCVRFIVYPPEISSVAERSASRCDVLQNSDPFCTARK